MCSSLQVALWKYNCILYNNCMANIFHYFSYVLFLNVKYKPYIWYNLSNLNLKNALNLDATVKKY